MRNGIIGRNFAIAIGMAILLAASVGDMATAEAAPHVLTSTGVMPEEQKPLVVRSPEAIVVPLYLVGDTLTNSEVEVYLWVETGGEKAFMDFSNGVINYRSFSNYAEMHPVINSFMVPFFEIYNLPMLDETPDMPEVDVTVKLCLDPVLNGQYDEADAVCGEQRVLINPVCEKAMVSPPTISLPAVEAGKAVAPQVISVTNGCGESLAFTAAAESQAGWLSIPSGSQFEQTSASVDYSKLVLGQNNGSIAVNTVYGETPVPVLINVTPPAASQWTLSVTKSGTGSGTVSASGMACVSNACTGTYNQGTTVAVTATPASGSKFSGWSGACTGTGVCNITMSANKQATATFSSVAGTCTPFTPQYCNQACTPSTINTSPLTVDVKVPSGGTVQEGVSISTDCSSSPPSSYGYSQTTGSGTWLAAQKSGSGLTLTIGPVTVAKEADIAITSGNLSRTVHVKAVPDICIPGTSPVVAAQGATGQTKAIGNNYSFDINVSRGCPGTELPFVAASSNTAAITIVRSNELTGPVTVTVLSPSSAGTITGTVALDITYNSSTVRISVPVSVTFTAASTNVTDLAAKGGQLRDFIVQRNSNNMYRFFATGTSSRNQPLQFGVTNTAIWQGYDVDVLVKWAGASCELGAPTMSDYNAVKAYLQTHPGGGCFSGTQTDCNIPNLAQGPNVGYYYHMINGTADELIEIRGGNPDYPGYPDQPHGCYYVMLVNPTNVDKDLSMFWADLDAYN